MGSSGFEWLGWGGGVRVRFQVMGLRDKDSGFRGRDQGL